MSQATSDNAVEALTAAKSERDAVAKERDALALHLAKATQDRAAAQVNNSWYLNPTSTEPLPQGSGTRSSRPDRISAALA